MTSGRKKERSSPSTAIASATDPTLINPATDPAWSWSVWQEKNQGKNVPKLPKALRETVRGTRVDKWSKSEAKQIYDFWLKNLYAGTREVLAPLEAEKAPFVREKAKLEKEIPITFVMAGDGDLRDECQALATSLGIADRVRFLGVVPHASAHRR